MTHMPKGWRASLAWAVLLLAACQRPAVPAAPSESTPAASVSPAHAGDAEGAAAATPAATSGRYAGWYLQRAGTGRFQPCGRDAQWAVGQGADLAERARDFGLMDDTPVYVRVTGDHHDGVLDVRSVEQFGAPAPVRDCAMTGVVIQ